MFSIILLFIASTNGTPMSSEPFSSQSQPSLPNQPQYNAIFAAKSLLQENFQHYNPQETVGDLNTASSAQRRSYHPKPTGYSPAQSYPRNPYNPKPAAYPTKPAYKPSFNRLPKPYEPKPEYQYNTVHNPYQPKPAISHPYKPANRPVNPYKPANRPVNPYKPITHPVNPYNPSTHHKPAIASPPHQYNQQSYHNPPNPFKPQPHRPPVSKGPVPVGRPGYKPGFSTRPIYEPEYYEPRPYSFDYGVNDEYTGTNFGHSEVSDGNAVTGEYSVVLPDGRLQRVTYVADQDNGYQAEVTYEYPQQYVR